MVDRREDDDEPGDAAGGKPDCGRDIVVERGERARGDAGEHLQRRGGNEPGQELGRVVDLRAAGQPWSGNDSKLPSDRRH